MRTKHRAALAASFVSFFCLATACSDDGGGSPSGNGAGESGVGAGSGGGGNGSGGKQSAGNGGTMSGSGGEPMGNAGESPENGGQASGDGGKPSSNGGESSGGDSPGGNAAGSGGESSGGAGAASDGGAGGAGGAGGSVCTPLTIAPFGQAQVNPTFADYVTSFTPNLGAGAADKFHLVLEGLPYDGDKTGTFDLTQNGDDNYKTCARCLFVDADGNQKIFYASQGTLQIAAGSKQLGGSIDATITNLKLVEVTIASDSTSTPVTNGACLTVASAAIQVEAPPCGGFQCDNGYCRANADDECDEHLDCPDESDEFPVNVSCEPVWLCDQGWLDDGDCDCGCGIKDVDCAGTANENECDYCVACQGNTSGGCNDNEVNPANTTQCL